MSEIKNTPQREPLRVELVIPVKYRPFRNDSVFQGNFNVGRSHDLSVSGMTLSVGRHNVVGSKLDLELELPGGSSAYVSGNVIGGEDEVIDGIAHGMDKIAFSKMDEDAENLITHQIFEIMRKKSGKGR